VWEPAFAGDGSGCERHQSGRLAQDDGRRGACRRNCFGGVGGEQALGCRVAVLFFCRFPRHASMAGFILRLDNPLGL
jgi:hypothetical protein